jgi:hypothetical protein
MDPASISFHYTFLLGDGRERTFRLQLNARSLALEEGRTADTPPWTQLSCSQCPNCPLSPETDPTCPIAHSIVDLVGFFDDAMSYDEVDVRIGTDERSYLKRTNMAEAISSLLGIYMVTSGCPVMDKLRPMVRFHLPLASLEETTFRAIAMYLVAQYFVARRGGKADWELQDLPDIYREVQTVNRSFMERLQQTMGDADANPNALVRLDTFASMIVLSLDMDRLDSLEALFEPYLPAEDR